MTDKHRFKLASIALFCIASASTPQADLLPITNQRFEKAVKGGSLKGFQFEGTLRSLDSETLNGGKLELDPGTRLWAEFVLPEPPNAEKFEPADWFALATLDVLAVNGEGPAEVSLLLSDEQSETPFAQLEAKDITTAQQLSHVIPASVLASRTGQRVRVEIRCAGAAIEIDNLILQRFHPVPTTKLLGKANGHLGPDRLDCGALGFVALTEHMHTAFSVVEVRAGGPAEQAGLRVGDVVTGVDDHEWLAPSSIAPGWDWFERSHEAVLGRAIEQAREQSVDTVRLRVIGKAGARQVAINLPAAELPPAEFPLSGELYDDLVRWTVTNQQESGGWKGTDSVNPALGGLALLGTRDKQHRKAIERCVDYLLGKYPKPSEMTGLAYWAIGYTGIFFAEYHLASGDERVLPWMREALAWLPTTTHECKWGCQAFGHGPDGLPYDEKALMSPAAHLLVFDALARKCGVETNVWEHIQEYVVMSWSDPASGGHGGMGYNKSYKDRAEFWSRSGLVALAEALRGDKDVMRSRLTTFMEERHPWMLNSHAYGEPGAALGLIALSVANPDALARILPQWRWRFANAWEPGYGLRFSTPHMGAPYMGQDEIVNLAYLVVASVQKQGLVITGGDGEPWL